MWTQRRALGLATAALLLGAMTSCADDRNDPPAGASPSLSSPTSTAPTPTTAPTPSPSDTEIASAAASAALRQYFATVDLVRQDSKRPSSSLDAVASSAQLTAQKKLLKSQRDGGLHQVGGTKIVNLQVKSIGLDSPATALVDVCWDVSGVDIVDSDGNSVVSPNRKDIGWTRFTVTNDKWASAPTDGWRVSGGSDLEVAPCAGS